jgi:hypothetical protein
VASGGEYIAVVCVGIATTFIRLRIEPSNMATIELDEETVERLDSLRIEDESYDEIVTELINIYEAEEMTLFKSE